MATSIPLRIVYDNAADRGAPTASSTVGSFIATNLTTDSKSEIWRSAAGITSATLSVSWTTAETISCVALPFTNFSPTATMRVRLYSDTAGTAQIFDSGVAWCALGAAPKIVGLTAAQSASAYSIGGGTAAVLYFTSFSTVKKIVIDIVDTNNLQGYLEASRLVVGAYWSPTYHAEMNASVTFMDTTKNIRTDAGNLMSDVGVRYKKLSANLAMLLLVDRANLWNIVRSVGISSSVFFSLYPQNADSDLEQAHTVYGRFTSMSAIAAKDYKIYSAPLEIEGV